MWNHWRPFSNRRCRALMIGVGALGALAALDALALFVFLLFAAIVVAPLGPYVGLLAFVVVPLIVVLGGALALTGYEAWLERPEDSHTAHEPGEDAAHQAHA